MAVVVRQPMMASPGPVLPSLPDKKSQPEGRNSDTACELHERISAPHEQSRHQPMAPILVSVLADREGRLLRHQPPATYQAFLELAGRRMARVLVEAYAQDGLLSYTELQWVFLASAETVSRALDLKGAQTRSCSSPVLVEETAEQVASMHSASVILAEDGQLGGGVGACSLSARCGR